MDFSKPTFEQMTRHWFEGDSVIREWQHEEGKRRIAGGRPATDMRGGGRGGEWRHATLLVMKRQRERERRGGGR
jgi:hypothetical protein